MAKKRINRREVWWVNFDPSIGSEIKKMRPAVVISNNISNRFLSRYQVIPLTRNINHIYPSEVLVNLNGETCKAVIDQISTVSVERFDNKIGTLSTQYMKQVEKIIKRQLDLK